MLPDGQIDFIDDLNRVYHGESGGGLYYKKDGNWVLWALMTTTRGGCAQQPCDHSSTATFISLQTPQMIDTVATKLLNALSH
jgi:hypothetical protein